MKLVSLYIENFGGLREYALDFSDGLNVLAQPNGFGKTTLAEFIRAMLYGFPKKQKALEKDLRRKYTPWQGGRYGGNLVFEVGGVRYRVERTFGSVPREDTFALFDMTDNRKSRRFSEGLGRELFGMDGESFARSTYLSQYDGGEMGTTGEIQAKLTNLAHETMDMQCLPEALRMLKNARSDLIPYRGSGGAVAEARNNVLRVRERMEALRALEPEAERLDGDIAGKEHELDQTKERLRKLQEKIHTAAAGGHLAAVHREYDRLSGQLERLQIRLEDLLARYPRGIPSEEELEAVRQTAEKAALQEKLIVTNTGDPEAAAFVRTQEERFSRGVPTEAELENWEEKIRGYRALHGKLLSASLSQQDRQILAELEEMEASGKLYDAYLRNLEDALAELERARDGLREASADGAEFTGLEAYFARGIPEEAELRTCMEELAEAKRLEDERRELTGQLAEQQDVRFRGWEIGLWILAAVGAVSGILLLVSHLPVWGAVCLGLGLTALLAAQVYRRSRRREKTEREALLARSEDLQRQILRRERRVREFVGRFPDADATVQTLYRIQQMRVEYLHALACRQADAEKRKNLERIARENSALLTQELGTDDFRQALRKLHQSQSRLRELQTARERYRETAGELRRELELLRSEIQNYFKQYAVNAEPEQFERLLSALREDVRKYADCRKRAEAWQRRRELHDRAAEENGQILEAFCRRFGLEFREDMPRQLQEVRDDIRDHGALIRALREAAQEREAYRRSHAGELAQPVPEETVDLQLLQTRETELTSQIERNTGELAELRQRRSVLADSLAEMPALCRELERWTALEQEKKRRAVVLDGAMAYLERARDNLHTGYLGPLRSRFVRYLTQISGECPEDIVVTPELKVSLMRGGAAREMAYFSAGQTDAVLLCMRFALVDALFAEEQPFVILDDPFVNLDDANTAQALDILRKLAEEKQILYMTCNTSRIPE